MKARHIFKQGQVAEVVTFAQAEGSILTAISHLGVEFSDNSVVALTQEGGAQVIRIMPEKEFNRNWQKVKEEKQAPPAPAETNKSNELDPEQEELFKKTTAKGIEKHKRTHQELAQADQGASETEETKESKKSKKQETATDSEVKQTNEDVTEKKSKNKN